MQKIQEQLKRTNFIFWARSDNICRIAASAALKCCRCFFIWKGKETHRMATARSACLLVILEESWAGRFCIGRVTASRSLHARKSERRRRGAPAFKGEDVVSREFYTNGDERHTKRDSRRFLPRAKHEIRHDFRRHTLAILARVIEI